ncbi:hypothetical protein [Nonomuraea candida]|uniref:hypothetical protein n=1 Tax=Nonomuraea candida TaxID=359159 RepID=UPI0005B8E075|nr:hypothetical protein [Nonomuraea candida]
MSNGKQVIIVQDHASGAYEVFGHVFTDKGLQELEAEAAQRGLTVVARARLTSKSDLANRPY